jgi:hypothetical protein
MSFAYLRHDASICWQGNLVKKVLEADSITHARVNGSHTHMGI